jgi:hypothetical protein
VNWGVVGVGILLLRVSTAPNLSDAGLMVSWKLSTQIKSLTNGNSGKQLTRGEKFTLLVLAIYADDKTMEVRPPKDGLPAVLLCRAETLERETKSLADHGLLELPNGAGSYKLLIASALKSKAQTKNRKSKQQDQTFILPDWLPFDAWNSYVEMRIKIRKPMTDRAKELGIMKLQRLREAGESAQEVLEQSIFNSWQGLFPVNRNGNGGGGNGRTYETASEKRDRKNQEAFNRVLAQPAGETLRSRILGGGTGSNRSEPKPRK